MKIKEKKFTKELKLIYNSLKEFEKDYKTKYYNWNIKNISYTKITSKTIICMHWDNEELDKWVIRLEKEEFKF